MLSNSSKSEVANFMHKPCDYIVLALKKNDEMLTNSIQTKFLIIWSQDLSKYVQKLSMRHVLKWMMFMGTKVLTLHLLQ